jgi:hypothetical protein
VSWESHIELLNESLGDPYANAHTKYIRNSTVDHTSVSTQRRGNAWLGGPISLSQCSFQGPLCIVGPIKIIRHYVLRLERMELKSLHGVLKNHVVLFLKI